MNKAEVIEKHARNLKSEVGTGLSTSECYQIIKSAVNEVLNLPCVSVSFLSVGNANFKKMELNLVKGKCGHCGNDKFEIYKPEDCKTRIITECTNCKCTSEITLTQPELTVKWHNESDGILHF